MKINKILGIAAMSALLFTTSCRKDDQFNDTPPLSKGAYENGILITNEGNFGKQNSEVSFIDANLNNISNGIFGSNNGNAPVGDVLNYAAFNGDNAYLVVNNSNKILKVNRYTFKKVSEISQNLATPRYMAFSNAKSYVTNNNFGFGTPATYKLTIYDSSDKFVKEILFDRYAEKVTAQSNYVYVQTDGTKYDANFNPLPTGHTITRINASTDAVDKTITLTDKGMIQDMASANGFVYVLTSDGTDSYLYKIDAAAGTFSAPTVAKSTNLQKMSIDKDQIYFMDYNTVYNLNANNFAKFFTVKATSVYGFNVIDGKVYVSDAGNFTANSKISVYNTSGSLLKEFTASIATNGFYKN